MNKQDHYILINPKISVIHKRNNANVTVFGIFCLRPCLVKRSRALATYLLMDPTLRYR